LESAIKALKVEKVSDSVYADTSGDGMSNLGAIVSGSSIIAVDASMFPSVARAFRKDIESETQKRFTQLILTHFHADHVFGNQVFKDCTITSSTQLNEKMIEAAKKEWTPEALEDYMQADPSVADKLKGLEITFPSKTFESALTIRDKGTRIDVRCVGGHTIDSSYVYLSSEEVLFSGDLIFSSRFPFGADPSCDPEKWLHALRELKQLKFKVILPGHGPACDIRELMKYIDFFERTTKIIQDIVRSGGSKDDALKFKDYPEFYPPRRPESRTASLSNWYEYYENRLQNQKRHDGK
jgi:glyoxylase-like metal-dependent hydrolase (beta-lactamase superfamily II)